MFAKSIDEYLEGVKPDQRAALTKLRKAIRDAAPGAVEGISYGLAAFRLGKKPLVAFGAGEGHCSFFPMTGHTVAAHAKDLAGFETSRGTIRFQPEKPLPAALVKMIVKERIAEVEGGKPRNPEAGPDPITAYSKAQSSRQRAICDRLRELIDAALPGATSKVWHGGPVWFIGENPVVGYDVKAKGVVSLLFWNGRAIDAKALEPVGKHRAAEARFTDASEVDVAVVRRWLKKAGTDVLDSKELVRKLRESRRPPKPPR